MDAPLIARLLSTLPTHDYTGAPLARQWAGLAWAQGLDTALAHAFLVSRDKAKSLIALLHSIMYLDYTFWTGRSAHIAVRPNAYWATHTRKGSGSLVRLAPLTSGLAWTEGAHGDRHTLEPVVDLHGNYIPPLQRDGRSDVFHPQPGGLHEHSLLKPEISRRAAAIYGVNRERWARSRAF
ncbi:hypothetical protein RTBOTA2_005300 [Rhodotorula toruloides]|nr:hypothetical protein RTBOTA2_005300 [Rhodotorula toruloides]